VARIRSGGRSPGDRHVGCPVAAPVSPVHGGERPEHSRTARGRGRAQAQGRCRAAVPTVRQLWSWSAGETTPHSSSGAARTGTTRSRAPDSTHRPAPPERRSHGSKRPPPALPKPRAHTSGPGRDNDGSSQRSPGGYCAPSTSNLQTERLRAQGQSVTTTLGAQDNPEPDPRRLLPAARPRTRPLSRHPNTWRFAVGEMRAGCRRCSISVRAVEGT
jgi:hypothetical protein